MKEGTMTLFEFMVLTFVVWLAIYAAAEVWDWWVEKEERRAERLAHRNLHRGGVL